MALSFSTPVQMEEGMKFVLSWMTRSTYRRAGSGTNVRQNLAKSGPQLRYRNIMNNKHRDKYNHWTYHVFGSKEHSPVC